MPRDPLADWPTVLEAAKRLKLSKRALQIRIARREFSTGKRPTPGKKPATVVDPRDLERYLTERTIKPAVVPPQSADVVVKRTETGLRTRDPDGFRLENLLDKLQSQNLEHRDVLSLREAARLKGYSVRYFELLHSQGRLPFFHVPGCRGRQVRRRDLDQLGDLELPGWQSRKRSL